MNAAVPINANVDAYRASTDAAGLCKEIVKQTAKPIQGRRYVSVEGWQAIAIAHGCAASALDVERVNDDGMSGYRCVGVVRRMSDGVEISRGEGFLGDDESMWTKRPVYARRAMVQTRAISRACRSAFAHVVVMIDAGLSTTPAEEVPDGGFVEHDDAPQPPAPRASRTIDAAEQAQIMTLIEHSGADIAAFFQHFNITEVEELTRADFPEAKRLLEKKLTQRTAVTKPANPQADSVLDDEIPY